jgi:urease accessory protein
VTGSETLLTAMRLSDSMLPVGAYTASYGVEQHLTEGDIEAADELGDLIAGYLRGMIGPAEIVALGHAHRSAAAGDLDGVVAADERLGAATLPAEFRDSSTKAGGRLLELSREIDGGLFVDADADAESGGLVAAYTAACDGDRTAGHLPVALGVVCQTAGLDAREAALVSAYGSVTGLLGAAQRLGRFGHTAIQAQLSRLFPVVESICERYHDADLTTIRSFAPLTDVRGMAHERADRRLFMS